jgi:cellobiose phosphorylase
MGGGDWNDGMNRVGEKGVGESVWLAFFLYHVLTEFSGIAGIRNDKELEKLCLEHAELLKKNIEASGWDGKWYLRAFFDEGEPLGSASNKECSIDSIPQSWSVISGAGGKERARTAMDSFYEELVDHDHGLVLLLKPPFDQTPLNPGYIKGYAPGVRENGGQYTHAAIWGAMAFALLGDAKRAWGLFNMLNPVNLGKTRGKVEIYKVEPYVVAADIYSNPQHVGRGGWSWYTGSSGWMYRLITECLLGMKLENGKLFFKDFCLPADWKEYKIHYRFRGTFYHISFKISECSGKIKSMVIDGLEQPIPEIILKDDHVEHVVEIEVG